MPRQTPRHATQADAIGQAPVLRGEIVPRGTAGQLADLHTGDLAPAAPATAPAYYQTHTATTQQLPTHVAALLDHRLPAPVTPWFVQYLTEVHAWPGITAAAMTGLGWWAHTEPMHPWFATGFLTAGFAALIAGAGGHFAHGADADAHMTRGMALAGVGSIAAGAACGAGFSGISALLTAVATGAGYVAWHQWRHHKLERQRAFVVDYTAAATVPGALLPAPGTALAAPVPLSKEEADLRRAFAEYGVDGVTVGRIRHLDDDTYETVIALPPGRNGAEKVIGDADAICRNLGARQVMLTPTDWGNRVRVIVRYGDADPLGEAVPWPGPTVDDIAVPVPIGINRLGRPVELLFLQRHTLYAGKSGRGKSGGVNVAVCSLAAMKNAVIWGLDLKPGQLELGPYSTILDQLAEGVEDAALLLKAAIEIMNERGEILKEEREATGRPVREWDPNRHGPVLVIVIDEIAELLRLRKESFEDWLELMQVARALGIVIIGATQSPSAKALGNTTDGASQFTNTIGFQAKGATQTNVILGQGAHGEGWRLDENTLPLQGMFLARTPELSAPDVARGYWIDPDAVMEIVAQFADNRPELDERSAAARDRVLAAGMPTGTGPGGGGVPRDAVPGDRPRLRSVPTFPVSGRSMEPADAELWAVLARCAGDRGVTAPDLSAQARAAGHRYGSPSWVRGRLAAYAKAGDVEMVMDGQTPRYWPARADGAKEVGA